MRRMFLCALAFCFCGYSLFAQAPKTPQPPASQPQHVTKQALCHKTANPIEVDGLLTDWQDVDAKDAMVPGEADNVQKPKRYKGPQDASALVYTKWDDKNFYFAAVVTDDFVRNSHVEKELQEGDGLLLCLSPKTPSEFPAPKPDQPAPRYPYGFIVTAGDGDKVKPQFMTIMDANKNPVIASGPWLNEVKKAVTRTRSGYHLELSIPFSAMPDLKPAVGRAIGCEVCLYESDTRVGPTRRTTIIGWCSVKDRMDPTEGGKLTFGDANKEKAVYPISSIHAEELIKNPYKPTGEEYVARKPHDPFAANGIPFGLYFERSEREGILRKLENEAVQKIFNRISIVCESYLVTWQPERYLLKDLSLADAESVSKVIQRLGFLYTLTEQDEYADLARRTILRLCERSGNWSKQLDSPERLGGAAKLLVALAVGSDWIHNALNLDERMLVEKTLIDVGGRLVGVAGGPKISPNDKIIILSAVGICGAATRQRNELAKEWLLAAERAASEYVTAGRIGESADADAALFSIFTLVDPLKKALGRDLFSVMDMRALIARRMDALRTKTPSGWAIDPVTVRYAGQVQACVLLREAGENRDGLALWFYQTLFTDMPSSSRDADEIYSLL